MLFGRDVGADFDLATLRVKVGSPLSRPTDIEAPLIWSLLLSRRVRLSLAAGGGVDTWVEIVKLLLAGADVVTTASALVRHGPEHMTALVDGLRTWLEENKFASVDDVRGRRDVGHLSPEDVFLRGEYVHLLADYLPQLRRSALLPQSIQQH